MTVNGTPSAEVVCRSRKMTDLAAGPARDQGRQAVPVVLSPLVLACWTQAGLRIAAMRSAVHRRLRSCAI